MLAAIVLILPVIPITRIWNVPADAYMCLMLNAQDIPEEHAEACDEPSPKSICAPPRKENGEKPAAYTVRGAVPEDGDTESVTTGESGVGDRVGDGVGAGVGIGVGVGDGVGVGVGAGDGLTTDEPGPNVSTCVNAAGVKFSILHCTFCPSWQKEVIYVLVITFAPVK